MPGPTRIRARWETVCGNLLSRFPPSNPEKNEGKGRNQVLDDEPAERDPAAIRFG